MTMILGMGSQIHLLCLGINVLVEAVEGYIVSLLAFEVFIILLHTFSLLRPNFSLRD